MDLGFPTLFIYLFFYFFFFFGGVGGGGGYGAGRGCRLCLSSVCFISALLCLSVIHFGVGGLVWI